MNTIIARTWMGAGDLYYGVPDLTDAVFITAEQGSDKEKETILHFKLKSGDRFRIHIRQA